MLGLAADSRGKFVESVVFAVIGVIAGVVPYLCGRKDHCGTDEWK